LANSHVKPYSQWVVETTETMTRETTVPCEKILKEVFSKRRVVFWLPQGQTNSSPIYRA